MTRKVETVRLGDPRIAEVIFGQSPPSSSYNDRAQGLPFFQGKGDFGLIWPTPKVWCLSDGLRLARERDVLLSVRAPVGDVNIAHEDCVIGRGIAAIRAGPESDPWFLFFAMQHGQAELRQRATGSTFPSVNKSAVEDTYIPRFSLLEQRDIARQLRHVLACIELDEAARGAAEALKRATMHKLFTVGMRGEPQKETEIGPVPESWEVLPLGNLGQIGNGSTPRRTVPEYWGGGEFPWLTSAKVYDRIVREADEHITQVALKECHLPVLEPGAVLIAITGQGKTLGHCAVLGIHATINQHLAYLQPDLVRADPRFLAGYLETLYPYLRQVAAGGGSTKGALTCAFLRQLLVPLPTLADQKAIATILDAIHRKIALHRRKRALLEELFKSLLHKLMTGEIRVGDLELSALPESAEAVG